MTDALLGSRKFSPQVWSLVHETIERLSPQQWPVFPDLGCVSGQAVYRSTVSLCNRTILVRHLPSSTRSLDNLEAGKEAEEQTGQTIPLSAKADGNSGKWPSPSRPSHPSVWLVCLYSTEYGARLIRAGCDSAVAKIGRDTAALAQFLWALLSVVFLARTRRQARIAVALRNEVIHNIANAWPMT